jgi:hypothetical protein
MLPYLVSIHHCLLWLLAPLRILDSKSMGLAHQPSSACKMRSLGRLAKRNRDFASLGQNTPTPPIWLHRIDGPLCPVAIAAMDNMITLRARRVGRALNSAEHLFMLDGQPLSYECLSKELCRLSLAIGINGARFSGHSFRIGAATSALMAGVPDVVIQHLGRWKSDAFKRYVVLADHHPLLRTAQAKMAMYVLNIR